MNVAALRPAALPATVPELDALLVIQGPTLNDQVHEIVRSLWEIDEFQNYIIAVYDEDAEEGSLSADNFMAATMIRERAEKIGSPVAKKKLATIVKTLGVVLRRYHLDRKYRKNTVGGETVGNGNGNSDE